MSRGMTAGVLLLTMSAGWTFSAELRQEEHFDFSMCKFGKIDYPAFAKGLTSGSFDRITAYRHFQDELIRRRYGSTASPPAVTLSNALK